MITHCIQIAHHSVQLPLYYIHLKSYNLMVKFAKQWLFFFFHFPAMRLVSLKKPFKKSDWLFCFADPFSLAEKKIDLEQKITTAIFEYVALLRANHIARITSDLKMDLIKNDIILLQRYTSLHTGE